MYIAPNTTIQFIKNVALDNSYKNTIFFNSLSEQTSYFSGKVSKTLSANTYSKLTQPLRVKSDINSILECGYLRYNNESFENKWFYCFVTSCTYVNNETTDVTIELDVMQTWHFDYDVLQSFVEREHTLTDNIGDNLVPENLELGDYIINNWDRTYKFLNWKIVVASTVDKSGADVAGAIYSGIYSGVTYLVFDSANDVNTYLNMLTTAKKQDAIVNIYMMPSDFVSESGGSTISVEFQTDKSLHNIDGFVPRNKKLFTYPYNYMVCSNLQGINAELKYEYFSDTNCRFLMQCDYTGNPTVLAQPYNYKNMNPNINEKISLGNFPQCAYNIDSYKAWLAQNSNSWVLGLVGSALSTASSVQTGNAGTAVNGLISIGQSINQLNLAKATPPQAYGNTSSNVLISTADLDFWFFKVSIRLEFARIIDSYMNIHGYAVKRVKSVGRTNRPHWTYVKTIDVNLKGNVPANDLAKIRSVYDNGVTFWTNGDNIGNYSLDNSPV
jgi:hypothetical protein